MDGSQDVVETTPRILKGKVATKRSWSDLPPAVLCAIVDNFLAALPSWPSVPHSWKDQWLMGQCQLWQTLYMVQRLTILRAVCKGWEANLRTHWVYSRAAHLLDPEYKDLQWILPPARFHAQSRLLEGVGAAAAVAQEFTRTFSPPPRYRNAHHFAATIKKCCLPCRFTNLRSSIGVNAGRESYFNRHFGEILLCPRHAPRTFCGLCLKDEALDSVRNQGGQVVQDRAFCTISVTDDDEMLPGVAATCRSCRHTLIYSMFRGKQPDAVRRIIAQVSESFIESADGTIREVQADIEEKSWLTLNTNYVEIWNSAVALERMRLKQEMRAEREAEMMAGGSEARLQQLLDSNADPAAVEAALAMQTGIVEEEDDDDDDMIDEEFGDLLTSDEETNVLDISLTGWARQRILQGCWISPVDLDHGQTVTRYNNETLQTLPPAWHPVNSLATSDPAAQIRHPRTPLLRCPPPPSRIIPRTQWYWESSFRSIVLPALNNLVQRLVYEAESEGKDVCRLALNYTSYRLLDELTTAQLWAKDYDWSNCQTSPTITSSTTIDTSSDRDSPPSTIRTTPSPSPPASSNSPKNAPLSVFATQQQRTPQSATFPLPTRFVDHIPWIPRAQEHVGTSVHHCLSKLWVEACAGLFKCQCGICQRAAGITEARRRLRDGEEDAPAAKRQKAPSPPPADQRMRPSTPPPSSSPAPFEVVSEDSRSSSPVPSSLRRSRTITDDEEEDDGRDVKRMKVDSPTKTRRRSHEEVDSAGDQIEAQPKKIRMAADPED